MRCARVCSLLAVVVCCICGVLLLCVRLYLSLVLLVVVRGLLSGWM